MVFGRPANGAKQKHAKPPTSYNKGSVIGSRNGSDREITWAQFSPFDGADWHDAMETLYDRELALAEPAFGVDWFEAVSHCRWLTSQVGVAESEQS